MPLTACPDCEQPISTAAPTCPHCGRPRDTTPPPAVTRPKPAGYVPVAEEEPVNWLRTVGVLLLIGGAIWLLYALNMDTSVATDPVSFGGITIPSQRVNNLGLMSQKQNYIIVASLTLVAGLITTLFDRHRKQS